MGTVVPKVGLIEQRENHSVTAIIPDVEMIQGMLKTSSLACFIQGFQGDEGRAFSLCSVPGEGCPSFWATRGPRGPGPAAPGGTKHSDLPLIH